MSDVSQDEVEYLYYRLDREAEEGGYHLNPDAEFTKDLVRGLLVNEKRYGYWACPCRLASGDKSDDLDIICPCDYRDPDVSEYGMCYCALYVSSEVQSGDKPTGTIPERRPSAEERAKARPAAASDTGVRLTLTYPVWRCRVCGYLCARDEPPDNCPICRAEKDRFEKFM